MAIGSTNISFSDIKDEINSSNPGAVGSTNIKLAGGSTPQAGSLVGEAPTVNQVAPHSLGEFSGFSAVPVTPTPTPTSTPPAPTPTNTVTPTPTPTNTVTPTPTPTPSNTSQFYSSHLEGNGLSDLDKNDACSSLNTISIYTRDAVSVSGLQIGDTLYGDPNTVFANRWVGNSEWYGLSDSNGAISEIVVQIDDNGEIVDLISCTSVTPTPTPTNTVTPTPTPTPTSTPPAPTPTSGG